MTMQLVLGIETSCDETAAAVVRSDGTILSNKVLSQFDEHLPYGGVVPEIAARAHLDHLDHLVEAAMDEAGVGFGDLDAVAATGGPGLIGGVMVGVMAAKSIALAADKPFLAVNHLEAHALTVRLTERAGDGIAFPYLLLLVSGGHCQLLVVEGVGAYRRLGTTIDDALGEAFDKTAKLLGLGYPGGPALERAARAGAPGRVELPRPMKGREGCDFSFSGLKTAVRQALEHLGGEADAQQTADIALEFHAAAADVLTDRCRHAIAAFRERRPAGDSMVVAGGVAANGYLRHALSAMADQEGIRLVVPPPSLCTDNAAMVAWAGLERLRLGLTDELDFKPRPRWPLDPDAPKRGFAGVKA
ncbi:MAG: tRNA (adenosine(37)-N6)-threonylcarbamoyltransferase complex transferase subunit TsaD [Rhodospirillales bacterium]